LHNQKALKGDTTLFPSGGKIPFGGGGANGGGKKKKVVPKWTPKKKGGVLFFSEEKGREGEIKKANLGKPSNTQLCGGERNGHPFFKKKEKM